MKEKATIKQILGVFPSQFVELEVFYNSTFRSVDHVMKLGIMKELDTWFDPLFRIGGM